ncbi:MAG: ROK family protein [Clostridiales bacterium]|nr:ROK family protein [Clostridiales bacterium]
MKHDTNTVIKLSPTLKDYIWGGYRLGELFGRDNGGKKISESWEVSVHPDGMSKCAGGTLAEYLEKNPCSVDKAGSPFPILVKYIDAKQNLSVQVHPDDEFARRVENDNGKTEMWYIIEADDGAGIYCGFKRKTSKSEFLQKVKDGTVEELLNFIPVKAGDCYLITAGTVHAIGAGCVICEVQQSSNITYRVYDYNRKDANSNLRPLHIDKAVDVINFDAFVDRTDSGMFVEVDGGKLRHLTQCKYFRCRELLLSGEYTETDENSFVTLNVLDGVGSINGTAFVKGDSFFVPCGVSFTVTGDARILLVDKKPIKYYAGVDVGGTFIKCGIVSELGELIVKDKIPTGNRREYTEIAKDISALISRLANRAGVKLEAVGMGTPGTIDSANGVIVYSNNIAWENIPLGQTMKELTKLPVFITNDANAAALGESFVGAGRDYKNIVLVTLGTGVGGGIVLDGKLYEGGHSAGAELGHIVINMHGEKCTCGRRGCLEAYASATALIKQTQAAMQKDCDSVMWKLCGGDLNNVDGKTVFDGMKEGDKSAKKVFNKYIEYLAEGIANIANIFRPDVVLLGGGICAQDEVLLRPLRRKVDGMLFGGSENAPVMIATATLGNDAGTIGAARLAMCGDDR